MTTLIKEVSGNGTLVLTTKGDAGRVGRGVIKNPSSFCPNVFVVIARRFLGLVNSMGI